MATQPNPRPYSRSRPPSEAALKVKSLLSRYPHLDEQELTALVEVFPHLAILDYGLMTGDEALSDKLKAFERDHKRRLKAPLSSILAVIAVPAVMAVVVLWWMLV
jgi:hypothetical protein